MGSDPNMEAAVAWIAAPCPACGEADEPRFRPHRDVKGYRMECMSCGIALTLYRSDHPDDERPRQRDGQVAWNAWAHRCKKIRKQGADHAE